MDEQARKAALRMITYGLYVVGVRRGEEVNAFTANWLTQASFEPPLVVLCTKKGTTSEEMIDAGRVFSVNVLESGRKDLAAHFFKPVTRVGNKLGDVEFATGRTGCPILKDALGYFECEVVDGAEGGDHRIWVGRVVEAGVHREGVPLTLRETGWHYGG